jgi:hypothetical protein
VMASPQSSTSSYTLHNCSSLLHMSALNPPTTFLKPSSYPLLTFPSGLPTTSATQILPHVLATKSDLMLQSPLPRITFHPLAKNLLSHDNRPSPLTSTCYRNRIQKFGPVQFWCVLKK